MLSQKGGITNIILLKYTNDFCILFCFAFNFMCVGVCLHEYLCTMYMQCPRKSKEGIQVFGVEVTGGCKLPHGVWVVISIPSAGGAVSAINC